MSNPLLNILYSFPFCLYHSGSVPPEHKIQSHGLETFLWSHGGCSRCEFCTAAADGAHSQRKGSEAPTLKNKLSLRSAFTTESRRIPLRRTFNLRLYGLCRGARFDRAPELLYVRRRWVSRVTESEKTQTSDPQNKTMCTNGHRKCILTLTPAASKCASKTAGRLYFL